MVRSILLVILEAAVILLLGGVSGVSHCLDATTLELLLLTTAVFLAVNGMWRDFIYAFRVGKKKTVVTMTKLKKSLYAVEFVQRALIFSTILIEAYAALQLFIIYADRTDFVPESLTIIVVGFLYMAMLELFLMPVHANLMKRITEYMEEDERVEEAGKE